MTSIAISRSRRYFWVLTKVEMQYIVSTLLGTSFDPRAGAGDRWKRTRCKGSQACTITFHSVDDPTHVTPPDIRCFSRKKVAKNRRSIQMMC